jgi:hypothetical protein
MLARLRPRLTYANVMATLAFFLALSTGGAYATHLVVNSSDVVDESLTGADVRGKPGTSTKPSVNGSLTTHDISGQPANAANGSPFVQGSLTTWDIADGTLRSADVLDNSLTGADVLESSLGKVSTADLLDGIDSSRFVQNHGPSRSTNATGRGGVLSNRVVLVPGNPDKQLLEISPLGDLTARCTDNHAVIIWRNSSPFTIDHWSNVFGQWDAKLIPPQGLSIVAETDNFTGSTLALGLGNDPGPRTIAIVHGFAFQSENFAPCGFQAQATLWTIE